METNENLNLEIGTKDIVTLETKPVVIKDVVIEMQSNRDTGKEYGEKVICGCKHPDKEEIIKVSSAKYVNNNQIKTVGLWLNKDEDGLIRKNSALASFMCFFNVKKISDLKGKEMPTEKDDRGYLCFKAF